MKYHPPVWNWRKLIKLACAISKIVSRDATLGFCLMTEPYDERYMVSIVDSAKKETTLWDELMGLCNDPVIN